MKASICAGVLARRRGISTSIAMLPSSTGAATQWKRWPKAASSGDFSPGERKSTTMSSPSVCSRSRSAALASAGLPLRYRRPWRTRRPPAPARPPRSRALLMVSNARSCRPCTLAAAGACGTTACAGRQPAR
jgi:hypothetical protein